MSDTGGIGGFSSGPKRVGESTPSGDVPSDLNGPSKSNAPLNLTQQQMEEVREQRSKGGYSGPLSPLEKWFMDHSGGNPVLGIMMYQRFMQSMMMTTITSMSTTSSRALQRQKDQDRQSYGGMG